MMTSQSSKEIRHGLRTLLSLSSEPKTPTIERDFMGWNEKAARQVNKAPKRVIDKFDLGGELISMLATTLLPWAQVSNAGAAIVNAFFLYLSYNTPKSNPFSDPRYIKIFLMNEVADILGLIWGARAFFKTSSYCDICDPEAECYNETA